MILSQWGIVVYGSTRYALEASCCWKDFGDVCSVPMFLFKITAKFVHRFFKENSALNFFLSPAFLEERNKQEISISNAIQGTQLDRTTASAVWQSLELACTETWPNLRPCTWQLLSNFSYAVICIDKLRCTRGLTWTVLLRPLKVYSYHICEDQW